MLDITDYTSCDEVRFIIGVDELELPDARIQLGVIAQSLFLRLRSFSGVVGAHSGTAVELYDEISLIASPTIEEDYYISLIKQFAAYSVAETCCSGLSMFALKSDSDGKAAQSRFASDNTFRDVIAAIREQLASLVGLLEEALTGTIGYSIPSLTAIPPAVDVVTDA